MFVSRKLCHSPLTNSYTCFPAWDDCPWYPWLRLSIRHRPSDVWLSKSHLASDASWTLASGFQYRIGKAVDSALAQLFTFFSFTPFSWQNCTRGRLLTQARRIPVFWYFGRRRRHRCSETCTGFEWGSWHTERLHKWAASSLLGWKPVCDDPRLRPRTQCSYFHSMCWGENEWIRFCPVSP